MTELAFTRVAVIGAGTMGAGIAQVCAQAGADTTLNDISDEFVQRGLGTITRFLDKGVEKGKVTEDARASTLDRIRTDTDLAAAVSDADLVIEAVPEKLELKNDVFLRVAKSCGDAAVLATNTSSLSLRGVFADVPHSDRCIGMHFFNPVPIMKLLEIVRLESTDASVLDRVRTFAGQLGKEPIVVKDSPGFATSRLGVCLGLEAIRMLEAGVASAEDIDKAMELGYRHPMGPLKLTDLVGLDVRLAIADYLDGELDSPAFAAPDLMREMVKRGELGQKSGRGFYDWRAD
ncbi:MAG: 3-hydroxyacyl-CoA dehydrogenase family protein [Planctomycetes bacterium]|nr:3-hydroxyacyl-CoA dehydrogenase family protein [Planctomycetota bacterium]